MDQKTELIIKHMEMIQNIVVRMANNSFMIKGWSLTIISALLGLAASAKNSSLAYIAYLPAIAFWGLDAYFLSQERYFRRLYSKVREQLVKTEIADPVESFSMVPRKYAKADDHWFPVMRSRTLIIFHGMVISFTTVVAIFI